MGEVHEENYSSVLECGSLFPLCDKWPTAIARVPKSTCEKSEKLVVSQLSLANRWSHFQPFEWEDGCRQVGFVFRQSTGCLFSLVSVAGVKENLIFIVQFTCCWVTSWWLSTCTSRKGVESGSCETSNWICFAAYRGALSSASLLLLLYCICFTPLVTHWSDILAYPSFRNVWKWKWNLRRKSPSSCREFCMMFRN
jgi:hypothetical protein